MKIFFRTLKTYLLLGLLCTPSYGIEGVYQVIIKKQKERQGQRWTLLDWLGTKKKMALMDQWLALNTKTSNPLEVSFAGMKGDVTSGEGSGFTDRGLEYYRASLYYRFFGLSHIRQRVGSFYESKAYQANILLLGSGNQSTNIQVFYGVNNITYFDQEVSPSYWGYQANLYLLPFLGGFYQHRKYLSDTNGEVEFVEGSRQEYGGFLELWILRLKGSYIRERLEFRGSSIAGKPSWTGFLLGAELFF